MPIRKCKICGREFYVKPSRLKRGEGKFCSKKCQFEGQKKGKFVNCEVCGKKIWKRLHELKHSKSGKFFCSKSCQTKWRNKIFSGPKHPFWEGGIRVYRKILIENGIKPVCARYGLKDERVLTVHHLDRNRKNNSVKNLVWLCLNCHYLVHRYNESVFGDRGEVVS